VTSVGEKEEKANTIQPPILCFYHLQCGLIHPPSWPFKYFMVLIDASSRWSYVCLLSSRDMTFAKFLAQIIKLRAQFPDYTIKKIRLDNVYEFSCESFNNYCMSIGITVEH